jgi:hypothetical protein
MRAYLRRIGVAAGVLGWGAVAATAATEQSVVDFSVTGAPMTHRASGFLHSIDPANPPDAMIAPLKPQMLRVRPDEGFPIVDRAKALGVQSMQFELSDGFNPENDGPYPGDGGNWTPWETYAHDMAVRVSANSVPSALDIWNEPDLGQFWARTQSQFFEAWRRAVLQIRAVNPAIQVVGPSFSSYGNTKIGMNNFLKYAKANNVVPDVLSWHEYAPGFTSHVSDARSLMASNGIATIPISLNEIVGQTNYAYEPQWEGAGILPQYFSNVERANVASVAHASWNEPDFPGVNNSDNASLDGLLTPDTKQPRSTWWVYEKYGEMGGTVSGFTAGVAKNNKGLTTFDGLSTKEDGKAHVLIGRFRTYPSELDSSPVQVKLTNLGQVANLLYDGAVRVTGEQIADTDLDPSPGPVVRMDQILKVSNGQLVVPVNNFGRTDAYFLTIAAVGTWLRDGDGVWSDGTGWGGGTPPDGVGSAVRFGSVATAQRTIGVDSPRTVGLLTFDNPVGYHLTGPATLTIDNGPNTPVIEVLQGSNRIDAPVRTSATNARPNLTTSNGAKLTIGDPGGIRLAHLTLNTSGTLDTGGNDLLLDPDAGLSQAALVRQLLKQAYNTGQWNGTGGLRSSGVTATSGTALGYAEAGLLGLTTFQDQPIDPLAVLVRQTLPGDANLDGVLNGDDFTLIDRGIAKHLTGWVNGDFNYDNVVNSADYQILDSAFQQQGMTPPSDLGADLATIVPEPPAIALLGLLAGFLLHRPQRLVHPR